MRKEFQRRVRPQKKEDRKPKKTAVSLAVFYPEAP